MRVSAVAKVKSLEPGATKHGWALQRSSKEFGEYNGCPAEQQESNPSMNDWIWLQLNQ
jgi:hypothetical protein